VTTTRDARTGAGKPQPHSPDGA